LYQKDRDPLTLIILQQLDTIPQKGIYAKLFEKCYNDLIRLPKYNTLF